MKYILKDKTPVLTEDVLEWAHWMQTQCRSMDVTYLTSKVRVSTVFLGIDHGFLGRPILFETMVFRRIPPFIVMGMEMDQDALDQYTERHETFDEAQNAHERIVARVSQSIWQRLRKRKKETLRHREKWSVHAQ